MCSWSGAAILVMGEYFSSVLLYIKPEQGHFLHLATIAVELTANRHNVIRGSVQVSEAPQSEDMAAIFP